MLRYDDRNESYTSFILENDPWNADSRKAESIDECKLIIRTRADKYPNYSAERYEVTENCGSQIITTDFPEKADGNGLYLPENGSWHRPAAERARRLECPSGLY